MQLAIIALAIFLLTYALISLRKVGRWTLDRPAVALFGAVLMILLGVVAPGDALAAIDLNTIALLLGMMLVVVSLELCGFFDLVARRMIAASKDQRIFLAVVMVTTAFLSALILNDAVVLLFTPVIIKACRAIKANPVPYLIAEAISANIGSVATPVGNPQNAFIAMKSGIDFVTFVSRLLPTAIISLVVAFIIIWFVFKKHMGDATPGGNGAKRIDCAEAARAIGDAVVHPAVKFVLAILVLVVIGFLLSGAMNVPLSIIALSGGAALLMLLPFLIKKATPKIMLAKVDWGLLIFFAGLFIVLKGVQVSGLLDDMMSVFQSVSGGSLSNVWGLSAFSAILSNLISNVPAVMLLAPFVGSLGQPDMWLALAGSSTLAGNATILGAAANVIVVESALGQGVEVSLKDFVKAGLPITIITLIVCATLLSIL
ncbi:MAG: SLC13 family permease [Methanomassiliicoccales archaeon]